MGGGGVTSLVSHMSLSTIVALFLVQRESSKTRYKFMNYADVALCNSQFFIYGLIEYNNPKLTYKMIDKKNNTVDIPVSMVKRILESDVIFYLDIRGGSRMLSEWVLSMIKLSYLLYVFGQTRLSKSCRQRSVEAECGVRSGSTLFATYPTILLTSAVSNMDCKMKGWVMNI